MIRNITFLNNTGHMTIGWIEENDEKMLELIKKKMEQGVQFFIIEPRMGGFLPSKHTTIKKATDTLKTRSIGIPDEFINKFYENGTIEVVNSPDANIVTKHKSKDAEEIVKSESVAVAPKAGG